MPKVVWKPGNMLYPLPAVMVSCRRGQERPNIITVAWTGTVCSSPAMVCVSIRPERYSHDIIQETGEFVINLTTQELVRAMDYCGVRSGRDVDKFRELHLDEEEAAFVKAPLIAQSPVNIECRVTQVLPLGSHDLFLAQVLAVDVDDRYLNENGKFDLNRAGLAVYSHGSYFGLGKELGSFGWSVKKKTRKPAEKEARRQAEKRTGTERVKPAEKETAKKAEKRTGTERAKQAAQKRVRKTAKDRK